MQQKSVLNQRKSELEALVLLSTGCSPSLDKLLDLWWYLNPVCCALKRFKELVSASAYFFSLISTRKKPKPGNKHHPQNPIVPCHFPQCFSFVSLLLCCNDSLSFQPHSAHYSYDKMSIELCKKVMNLCSCTWSVSELSCQWWRSQAASHFLCAAFCLN